MNLFKKLMWGYIIFCLLIISILGYTSYNNYTEYEEYIKEVNKEYGINATYGDVIIQHDNGTYEAIPKDEWEKMNTLETKHAPSGLDLVQINLSLY